MGWELWKLALGGAISLVLALLGHQLQLGGRRRRLRRDIREELELLALLDEGSDVANRIQRRVDAALLRYEPSPGEKLARWQRWAGPLSIAGTALVIVGPTVVIFDLSTSEPLWFLLPGVVAASAALALESLIVRWRATDLERRSRDDLALRWRRAGADKS